MIERNDEDPFLFIASLSLLSINMIVLLSNEIYHYIGTYIYFPPYKYYNTNQQARISAVQRYT